MTSKCVVGYVVGPKSVQCSDCYYKKVCSVVSLQEIVKCVELHDKPVWQVVSVMTRECAV